MAKDRIREVEAKLKQISQVVSELDPAIRAQAFELLARLYFPPLPGPQDARGGDKKELRQRGDSGSGKDLDHPGRDTLFTSFEHNKPADNVKLIVAWLYSQYGVFPITGSLIKENAASLTVPERPDMTMRNSKDDGKRLFRKKGAGFQLTVHGEELMKKTYSVKKGTKPVPQEDEKQ